MTAPTTPDPAPGDTAAVATDEPFTNEVFAVMTAGERDRLLKKGAVFFDWHTPHDGAGELAPGEIICRFVTSFATSADDVDALGKLIG